MSEWSVMLQETELTLGFLGAIGGLLSSIGGSSWLSGLGNILGIGSAGASIYNSTRGSQQPQSVLSDYDWSRWQRQTDAGNWKDIARQNDFLRHVTPVEAEVQADAYNYTQDATFGEDTRRQQERLDALFPGTSPWERLGSPAGAGGGSGAVPTQSTDPTNNTAFMGELIRAQTARDTAQIQADAQIQTAQMQTGANLYGSSQQSINTQEANRINEFGKKLQERSVNLQQRKDNQQIIKEAFETIPEEKWDVFFAKASRRPGWESFAEMMMGNMTGTGAGSDPDRAWKFAKSNPTLLFAMEEDIQQASKRVANFGEGGLTTMLGLSAIPVVGTFLNRLGKGRVSALGRKRRISEKADPRLPHVR